MLKFTLFLTFNNYFFKLKNKKMRQKIIKVDDYVKYFTRNNPNFLANWNNINGQNYFFFQVSFPLEYLHDEDGFIAGNQLYRKIIANHQNEFLTN